MEEESSRNMYKGPMDKAKREWVPFCWEVGMDGMGGSGGEKWRKLYLNSNLKKREKNKLKKEK